MGATTTEQVQASSRHLTDAQTVATLTDQSPSIATRKVSANLVLAICSLCVGVLASTVLLTVTGSQTALLIVAIPLAFAGGLLSTWSPCGYSSLSLLRPRGRYGMRAIVNWVPTLVTHALGYMFGAAVLGGVLGFVAWLAPSSTVGGWSLLAVGLVAIGYGFHCLGLVRMPYPERCVQVSHGARNRHAMWKIGWAYGLELGLNFVTYVRSPILYVVVALAMIGGTMTTALALIAALNLGRWLPLVANALPIQDQDIQRWLASNEQNARLADGALLTIAGMAFVVFALV